MNRIALLLAWLALPLAALAQPGPFVQDTTSPLTTDAKPSLSGLWGDYDGDGDLDLLVTQNVGGPDDLFRNVGDGAFSRIPFESNEDPFATSTSGTWADFNNDGRLDLVTASLMDGALFINRGPTDFRYIRLPLDRFEATRDVLVADYNEDGLLDGVLVRGIGSSSERNILIENIGNTGVVVNGSAVANGAEESASGCWGDYDGDGFTDLFLGNNDDPNRFFRNVNGTLVETADPVLAADLTETQGCSWGDYDGDGDLDLLTTSASSITRLYRNDGTFTEVTDNLDPNLVGSVGSAWGDVDNDGDLDLVVVRDDALATLYLNDGSGQLTGTNFGGTDSEFPKVTLADDDADGDLDIFIPRGNFTRSQRNLLYRNTTTGSTQRLAESSTADGGSANWLEVALQRTEGRNRFGVGALITAYVTIDDQARTLLRPVEPRSGRAAQSGYQVHFGLGDATVVDSLVVAWSAGVNDQPTVLTEVAVNQAITVTGDEDETARALFAASTAQTEALAVESIYPNPSAGAVTFAVRSGSEDAVEVSVFDVTGRLVKSLSAEAAIGTVAEIGWSGADEAGRALAGGVYIVRVQQGADQHVAKLTLLR